jgi:hypothetical protein
MKKTILTLFAVIAFGAISFSQEFSKAIVTSSSLENEIYTYEITDLVSGEVYQSLQTNLLVKVGQELYLHRFPGDGRFMKCLIAGKSAIIGNDQVKFSGELFIKQN